MIRIVSGEVPNTLILYFFSSERDFALSVVSGQWNQGTQFFLKIIIAAIPIALVGLFFEEQIEIIFSGSSFLVAAMLFLTGVLLLLSHLKITRKSNNQKKIGYKESIGIGLAQCIAILPGLSRSGATIAIGLLLGCEKKEIIRFSFLILLLPVLGASAIKLFEYYATATSIEFTISPLALIVSFFSAFISGYFCCRFVRYAVFHAKLHYFALLALTNHSCQSLGIVFSATAKP